MTESLQFRSQAVAFASCSSRNKHFHVIEECNRFCTIKDKENFPVHSQFVSAVFYQLNFMNCIIRCAVDYSCITCCWISLNNKLLSFAV